MDSLDSQFRIIDPGNLLPFNNHHHHHYSTQPVHHHSPSASYQYHNQSNHHHHQSDQASFNFVDANTSSPSRNSIHLPAFSTGQDFNGNSISGGIPSLSSLAVPSPVTSTAIANSSQAPHSASVSASPSLRRISENSNGNDSRSFSNCNIPPPGVTKAIIHNHNGQHSNFPENSMFASPTNSLHTSRQTQRGNGSQLKASEWSTEELQLFGDALAMHGDNWESFWDLISMTSLAVKRCKDEVQERWNGVMGSKYTSSSGQNESGHISVNRGPSWNEIEINALKRAVAKHQLKWKAIKEDPEFRQYFQGRTEHSLKSKWNRIRLEGKRPESQNRPTNTIQENSSDLGLNDCHHGMIARIFQQDEHQSALVTSASAIDANHLELDSRKEESNFPNASSEGALNHMYSPAFMSNNSAHPPGVVDHHTNPHLSFENDFHPFGSSHSLFNDLSKDALNGPQLQLTAQVEGSVPRLDSERESSNELGALEIALEKCSSLQLPDSLLECNNALFSLGVSNLHSGSETEVRNMNSEKKKQIASVWFVKALSHFQQGLYDLALEDCDTALSLHADFAVAYALRGLASLNLGAVSGVNSPSFKDLSQNAYSDFKRCLWPSEFPQRSVNNSSQRHGISSQSKTIDKHNTRK